MIIHWTQHAKERFAERALIYGISLDELEQIVKKQEVRINRGFDEKFKKQKFEAIGLVCNRLFTIQKIEDSKNIIIITFWESSKKEEEFWNLNKKQNAHSAMEWQNFTSKQ